MARDLEDCYPSDGGLGNSWWRPTTVVKSGRAYATLGQGPVYNKGECGKVRGGGLLTYQFRTNQATRPAAYPYARTLHETRQPTQYRARSYHPGHYGGYGYGHGYGGYGGYGGCGYGGCGYGGYGGYGRHHYPYKTHEHGYGYEPEEECTEGYDEGTEE